MGNVLHNFGTSLAYLFSLGLISEKWFLIPNLVHYIQRSCNKFQARTPHASFTQFTCRASVWTDDGRLPLLHFGSHLNERPPLHSKFKGNKNIQTMKIYASCNKDRVLSRQFRKSVRSEVCVFIKVPK